MLNFVLEFSLCLLSWRRDIFSFCFPPWRSGIVISQSFTKFHKGFTKFHKGFFMLNLLLNFLNVFCLSRLAKLCPNYGTKFHKGFTKFHKGILMLNFALEFSLCLLSWRSGIAISQSFTKDSSC